jgi:cell wall-associated NlpC family hydrolase
MSFEAAVGQVDQILQWQEQIADPLASQTASGATGTTTTDTDSGTTDSEFAAALAGAKEMPGADAATAAGTEMTGDTGLTALLSGGDSQLMSVLASLGSSGSSSASLNGSAATAGVSEATSSQDPRITAMVNEANALIGKPYVWGGGHNGWGAQGGYDCSGFVSAVLHAGGYLSSPQDTATLPSAPGIEQGPGQYVTIYDRDAAGEQGHVIIEIDGQFYESGGQAGSWGGGGGVEKISTPSASYLSSFNEVLHPAGL